jgi:hypothetical protein
LILCSLLWDDAVWKTTLAKAIMNHDPSQCQRSDGITGGESSSIGGLMSLTQCRRSHSAKVLFTSTSKSKNFQDSPSHRIFRRINRVLNIDKNKN